MSERNWRYLPLFLAVGSTIFSAGITWANVSGFDGRITKLETSQSKYERRQVRMDGNLELLLRALHVDPLPRIPSGEEE